MRYKNNKFLTNHLDNFLAWNLLFLSHKQSRVCTRYFIRLCIIILSICVVFFGEFRRPFCCGLHKFSQKLWLPPDMFPVFLPVLLRRTDSMLVVLIRPGYQVYTFGNSTIKLCIETDLILQIWNKSLGNIQNYPWIVLYIYSNLVLRLEAGPALRGCGWCDRTGLPKIGGLQKLLC